MSANDYCSDFHPDVAMPNHELLEVHRSIHLFLRSLPSPMLAALVPFVMLFLCA